MSARVRAVAECRCPACPGRGTDGHAMRHCAECCWGTGVEAEPDCHVHGQPDPGPLTEYRVTFGQRYAGETHPRFPAAHPDGWATIMAADMAGARAIAVGALGRDWCEVYAPPFDGPNWVWYPMGPLGVIESPAHPMIETEYRVDVDLDRNLDPYLIHTPCGQPVCLVETATAAVCAAAYAEMGGEPPSAEDCAPLAIAAVDALLPVVTTREQVDALPAAPILAGLVWAGNPRAVPYYWTGDQLRTVCGEAIRDVERLVDNYGPLTVVWTP